MKNLSALFFFCIICISAKAQFVKEHTYQSNQLRRVLMSEGVEAYAHFTHIKHQVILATGDHQIIDSIAVPTCNNSTNFLAVRDDYGDFGIGFIHNCRTDMGTTESVLLDIEGDVRLDLHLVMDVNENFIIDFDEENFITKVYSTQTLELLQEFELQLSPTNGQYVPGDYYIGHNNFDKLILFDEALNEIITVPFDFATIDFINIVPASTMVNDQEQYYFMVFELGNGSILGMQTLIDETGGVIGNFENQNATFFKNGNQLQMLFHTDVVGFKVSTMLLPSEEIFEINENAEVTILQFASTGEYMLMHYDDQTSIVTTYGPDREIKLQFELNDPNAGEIVSFFTDHNGQIYFKYQQQVDGQTNVVILKETEFLQVIENRSFVGAVGIEGFETKLLARDFGQFGTTDVYGFGPSGLLTVEAKYLNTFPNPVKDRLEIENIDHFNGPAGLEICDMNGRILLSKKITSSDHLQLNVSHLNTGMYFLKIHFAEGYGVSKFYKE